MLLSLCRSRYRAVVSASTAINAGVSVNNKLAIAFSNRTHRAVASANAARDAIVRNLVCHSFHLLPFLFFTDRIISQNVLVMQH